MKIVIIGAGDVGSYLAQYLCRDRNELILIDTNRGRLDALSERLDLAAYEGSATSLSRLQSADVGGADYFIAATSIDEINALSCNVAAKLGVGNRIARIRNDEFSKEVLAMQLADLCVNPEKESARTITELVMHSGLKDFQELAGGRIRMISLDVAKGSIFDGCNLSTLARKLSHLTFRVTAVLRRGVSTIPTGNATLQAGDTITMAVPDGDTVALIQASGVHDRASHNVMILGSTPIAGLVARALSPVKGINLTLFGLKGEGERTSFQLAEELPGVMVFETAGKEIDAMAQEALGDMDTFLALTDEEEKNIITSLVAKHLGVGRTITMIQKAEYMPIVKTIGLDIGINKRIITAQEILKHVRRGRLRAQVQLPGAGVNVLSFEVSKGSRLADHVLSKLKLPADCVMAAVQRGERAFVPDGESRIEVGDLVTVVTLEERQSDLERFFG